MTATSKKQLLVAIVYAEKVVGNPEYGFRPQVSRQMPRVGLMRLGDAAYPLSGLYMPIHCHA